jgi:hypothetical protein
VQLAGENSLDPINAGEITQEIPVLYLLGVIHRMERYIVGIPAQRIAETKVEHAFEGISQRRCEFAEQTGDNQRDCFSFLEPFKGSDPGASQVRAHNEGEFGSFHCLVTLSEHPLVSMLMANNHT